MKKLTLLGIGIYVYSFIPTFAFAAWGDKSLTENSSGSLPEFLTTIQNWLLSIVGVLALLFIVYGGFLYITSGGNKERIEMAKKTLTYAILGLLIVVFAGVIFGILTGGFLTSIFGNKSL